MTWAILAFLSHLVFIPGLYDGFSLPKRVYVFGLGIAAIIFLFTKRREFPLVGLISSYLFVSMIPFLWVANLPVFTERVALDVACFAVFWAVAVSKLNTYRINLVLLVAVGIAVVAIAAQHFFPLHNGTMGHSHYTAFLSSQASSLPLVMGSSIGTVLAAASLMFLSSASNAAFAAAAMSLFVFGLAQIFSIRYFFYAAVAVVILTQAIIRYDFVDLPGARKATWQNSVYMLEKPHEWIFGMGRGQFEIQYPAFANKRIRDIEQDMEVAPERKIILAWGHPHNEFLNSVIETGFLGSALFWVIIFFLIEPVRDWNRPVLVVICSLIGTILFSTFWFPFSHPSMAVTFWALAGLLWVDKSDDL